MKVSAVTTVGTVLAAAADGRQRKMDESGAGVFVVMCLIGLSVFIVYSVVYAVKVVMLLALSRYREPAADRAAVILTGKPGPLASILTRISDGMNAIPEEDLRGARSLNALSFAPALSAESSWGWRLSTHPTLQRHLDNIAKAGRRLGGVS